MPAQDITRHLPGGAMGTYADTQDVMTPALIWRPVLRGLRRDRFDVDLFCDARTRHNVPAHRHVVWPRCSAFRLVWSSFERPGGGLRSLWGNPPFGLLGDVLRYAAATDFASTELVLLVPLRPHRTYWRFAHTSELEVHLPAFAFEGQTSTFPLPCCLLYWGPRARSIAPALADIGTIVRDRALTSFDPGAILTPAMNTGSFQLLHAAWKVVTARLGGFNHDANRAGRRPGLLGYDAHSLGAGCIYALLEDEERDAFAQLLTTKDFRHDEHKQLQWAVESIENAIAFIAGWAMIDRLGDHFSGDEDEMFRALPSFVHNAYLNHQAGEKAKTSAAKKAAKAGKKTAKKAGKKSASSGKPASGKRGKKAPPKAAVVRGPQLVVAGTEDAKAGSSTDDALDAFIGARAVGDTWTMAELLETVQGSKATVLRALRKRAEGDKACVENFGSGRGSKWRRTA